MQIGNEVQPLPNLFWHWFWLSKMAANFQDEGGFRETTRKPFKVSTLNKRFKGIVAESLAELKVVACRKLEIDAPETVKVFLDEDMTEVDDEEYFQFLPCQSRLLLLTELEIRRKGIQPSSFATPNFERSESQVVRSEDTTDGVPVIDTAIKSRIISDPIFYLSLNDEELEKIISLDPELASIELQKSKDEVVIYQESCEREVSRRSELRDAAGLLQLYKKAKQQTRSNVMSGNMPS